MINYSLKCADGHSFDSWFQSAAAFDKLAAAGLVTCSFCGSTKVEKAIMAPRVRTGRKAVSGIGEPEHMAPSEGGSDSAAQDRAQDHVKGQVQGAAALAQKRRTSQSPTVSAGPGALSTPAGDAAGKMEQALTELRRQVEQNSDYVGNDFVSEARAMHLGEAPERAIHGEAKLDDAKALIEEGIPVLPLPFGRKRKTN